MKIHRAFYKGLAFLAILPIAAVGMAQEYTLTDAISGSTIPLIIKPADIPDDFRAVKITQAGANDSYGLGSMMPTLMAVGAVNNMGAPAEMFLEMLPITWTKGEMVTVAGQQYFVTYGIDMGPGTLKGMSGARKLQPFNLRLKLIKTSDIGSITPLPEWNKAKYLRAMAQVTINQPTPVAAIIKPKTISTNTITTPVASIPTTPVITTEPAPIKTAPDTIASIAPATTPTAVKGVSIDRPIDTKLYDDAQQNAKSICAAMLLYAQDYDGVFPYVQGTKGADYVIYPYIKSTSVYQTMNPVRPGEFRFNMSLAGVQMTEITDPANTPLFYDPFAWPNGTYLIGFADSHAKFVSETEWETIKKNLALKLKKTGSPLPASYGLPAQATQTPTSNTGGR